MEVVCNQSRRAIAQWAQTESTRMLGRPWQPRNGLCLSIRSFRFRLTVDPLMLVLAQPLLSFWPRLAFAVLQLVKGTELQVRLRLTGSPQVPGSDLSGGA